MTHAGWWKMTDEWEVPAGFKIVTLSNGDQWLVRVKEEDEDEDAKPD